MRGRHLAIGVVALTAALATPAFAITMDGALDPGYGTALGVQATQTDFGDASDGNIDFTNGSELDNIYAKKDGGVLHVFIGGNLESNYNKVEVFFDVKPGGQNQLRGDNPNVDFDGLNRMGDDGGGNGLKFDAGFEADYWIGLTNGDSGGWALFANYAELLTSGGGTGYYLGTNTTAGGDGTLSGGTNPDNIKITMNNSNTAGVDAGSCAAADGSGVSTGMELEIPMSALGGDAIGAKEIKICAFVNGSGHDYVSNQVLGTLQPTQCSLGDPRGVDFSALPGDQFVSLVAHNLPAVNPALLGLLSLLMAGAAVVVLRRKAVV